MRIHILSICGSMTTPLALALKKNGHQISGSDQEKIYPPFSTQLDEAHISINQPLDYSQIDLFIVGSAFKNFQRCLDEFDQIQSQHLPYISATEYLAKYVVKPNSILVAGSYGKSTIAALAAWILTSTGLNPSYFFGAQSRSGFPSLLINDSGWSVIEADESINGLDTQGKLLYYPAKYVILTSADWEHKDSYITEADNFNAFKTFVSHLPADGLLVYNPKSESAKEISRFSAAPSIPYDDTFTWKHTLIGSHNRENVSAVTTLCQKLGLTSAQIQAALNTFPGIKRRLEILNQNPLVIDDFAQAPQRLKSAVEAVASSFPDRRIKVFFEPHASFLMQPGSLKGLNESFKIASEVVLSKIKFNPNIDKNQRVTFANYQQLLGSKVVYLPLYEDIFKHYLETLSPSDVLIHFSSGGQDGLNLLSTLIRSILK